VQIECEVVPCVIERVEIIPDLGRDVVGRSSRTSNTRYYPKSCVRRTSTATT
jgi:hypothetical protein